MRSIPPEQRDELRAKLLGLAEDCPFHQANPDDCPLFPLRKLKATKRLQWFTALSEDDLTYLANYHEVCFTIKMASGLTKQETKTPAKRGSK